jgi:glutaredoxin-related protein
MHYLKFHKLSLKCKSFLKCRKSLKLKTQVGLTCGQFLQITPSFSMSITYSFIKLRIFLSEENFKMFLNMKKNGIMYEELKLKKGN